MKELCLKLVKAETENEVISILKKARYWDDPDNWKNIGQNENNFSVIGNQQSKPEAALVEKLVNSIDAVLMAEAEIRKINPEGPDSPQSIPEAVELFFKVPNGKLTKISPLTRTELANKIALVATGTRKNPCYAIIDSGEGQTPNKMPNTFLSIFEKSNKMRIPFVQGKFKMGGTGVFRFCGHHNLQLVISKRHPKIAEQEIDESKKKWGFTIIRRFNPKDGVRSSVYRYLAPKDKILSFESDQLPLLPGKEATDAYNEPLEWGSYIKLYEYQMTGLYTQIILDLNNRLALLLPSLALPIRLYERRTPPFGGKSPEATLSGLMVRLEENPDHIERGFPSSHTMVVDGQNMKASVYVFKPGKEIHFKKDEGIIFTINGQTHGFLDKRFFTREKIGMGYLKDSILVIVDCNDIEGRAREDLFMNSRDRLSDVDLRYAIEKALETIIKDHQGLKSLREQRKREAFENKVKDDKPLEEVINKMLKRSPVLSKLFVEGLRLPSPFNFSGASEGEEFKGKDFPEMFEISKEFGSENPKDCPINRRFYMHFITDAKNDYFNRDNDPGEFTLLLNDEIFENFSLNLWNGTANLIASIPSECHIGDKLDFKWIVSDRTQFEPFNGTFYVKVKEPEEKKSIHDTDKKKTHTPSDKNGDDVKKPSKLSLPDISEIRWDKWDTFKLSEESALKVIDNGEAGMDFLVNMDNKYLLTEIKNTKKIEQLEMRYKYGMVIIGLAFLNYNQKHAKASSNGSSEKIDSDNEIDIFSKIEYSTKVIAPFFLPMIQELGVIEETQA
ncbi:MAG: hypothetical protein ABSB80_06000 [Methanoregula sp.]|jgi:hypothetical protein|uniref:hypothetical protein n=1 Tax=Methanoregula sp. TaxID=2052170 RepID=UPI003D12F7DD